MFELFGQLKQIILSWVPVLTHRSELYSHTVGITVCIIQYQYTHHLSYWQTITYSDVLLRICLLDLLTYDWLTGGVANINTISHTRASSHAPFVCCCEVWNRLQAGNSYPEFVDSFSFVNKTQRMAVFIPLFLIKSPTGRDVSSYFCVKGILS